MSAVRRLDGERPAMGARRRGPRQRPVVTEDDDLASCCRRKRKIFVVFCVATVIHAQSGLDPHRCVGQQRQNDGSLFISEVSPELSAPQDITNLGRHRSPTRHAPALGTGCGLLAPQPHPCRHRGACVRTQSASSTRSGSSARSTGAISRATASGQACNSEAIGTSSAAAR